MVAVVCACAAQAEVTVSKIFGDHMVVQAGKPIPVWGWAKPGTKVEVSFLDAKTVTATAGKDGRWMAKVSPLKTGQTGAMTVSSVDSKIVAKDVLVGEVWLCSGQSNMEMKVAHHTRGITWTSALRTPKSYHEQRIKPIEWAGIECSLSFYK